jgi:hypothetical protein
LRNVGASALNFEETTLKNKVLCKIQINVFNIKPTYSSNNPRTIQKLQIDEQTFNDDLKIIEDEINKIEDNNYYFNNQLKLINTCEQLLESLVLIESQVNDIIDKYHSI